MSDSSGALMRGVAALLKLLIVLNIVSVFVLAAFFAASYAVEGPILAALAQDYPTISPIRQLQTARLAILITAPMVPLAHLLLTRLRAIVGTVQAGDPFVAANARRLTTIAWVLLGIQVVDLGYGVLSALADIASMPGWSFSFTGWLAVLLLFVLARVFEHGARMRDELAATI